MKTETAEDAAPAAVKAMLAQMRSVSLDRRQACAVALPALDRLCLVMQDRSGQCYKVRNLLYSLWNGKPAPLIEVTGLNWAIRKDLCAVILAFGYEDRTTAFFYDAIKAAVRAADQWDWFLEERHNLKLLAEYAAEAK